MRSARLPRSTLLICLSLGLLAATSGTSAAQSRIRVTGRSGNITVTGSPQAKQVSGGGMVTVKGDELEVRAMTADDDLALTVPAQASIEIKTTSGSVRVSGVQGSIAVRSVSGNVWVAGGRALEVRTVSGNVDADSVQQSVKVKAVSGDLRIKGKLEDVQIVSVSGTVSVTGLGQGTISTTSGNLWLEGTLAAGRRLSVHTHSGDLVAKLRAPEGLKYSLKSFSGKLEAVINGKSAPGGGRMAQGSYGAGRATVEAGSFSGDLRLDVKP